MDRRPRSGTWEAKVSPAFVSAISDDEAASGLLKHLRSATSIHLRSDVPVGTCLSGGIDSSTLTVLINSLIREEAPASVGSRQKTFSAVFTDKRFNESRYIDEIVAATGVDAHKTEPSPIEPLGRSRSAGVHAGRAVWFALDLCPVLRHAPCEGECEGRSRRSGG